MSRFLYLLAIGYSFCMLGCEGPQVGKITGEVKFKGESLPSGVVGLQGQGGWVTTCNIKAGRYEVDDVPPGEVKVTVQTFPPGPPVTPPPGVGPAMAPPPPPPKYVEIPAIYADLKTTPLSFVAKAGAQTHDILLEENKTP